MFIKKKKDMFIPKRKSLAQQVVECYTEQAQLDTDPMGSWTGKPADPDDVPVQDADDL